jgi:hypothetical protein
LNYISGLPNNHPLPDPKRNVHHRPGTIQEQITGHLHSRYALRHCRNPVLVPDKRTLNRTVRSVYCENFRKRKDQDARKG